MKTGFSLVEIMWTVILLGFIAGLSVSFFTRLNTDEKLYNSTVRMLNEAVAEANRRMCSDNTPVCEDGYMCSKISSDGSTTDYNTFDECTDVLCSYPNLRGSGVNSQYNEDTGLCEYEPASITTSCALGFKEVVRDTDNNGVPDEKICYSPIICWNGIDDDGNLIFESAVSRASQICPNGTPDYEGEEMRIGVTNFCYYMHDIINHKEQLGPDNDNDDLYNTCQRPVPCLDNLLNGITQDVIEDCRGVPVNDDVRPSLILPNGVMIYNLGGAFVNDGIDEIIDSDGDGVLDKTRTDSDLNILIKYDRSGDLRTITDNNAEIYQIYNPRRRVDRPNVAPAP